MTQPDPNTFELIAAARETRERARSLRGEARRQQARADGLREWTRELRSILNVQDEATLMEALSRRREARESEDRGSEEPRPPGPSPDF